MARNKDQRSDAANKVAKGYLQTTRYFNSSLNPGEEMLYRAHLSWIPVFVRQIPFMLIGGAVGGVVWGLTGDVMLGVTVFVAAMAIGVVSQIPRIWTNIGTDILLTNQGLHSKRGVFIIKDDRFTRLNMLDDSDIDYRSLFQRIFKYGDVEIKTVAGADNFYNFKGLARPVTFKNTVRAAQNRYASVGAFDPQKGAFAPGQQRQTFDQRDGRDGGEQTRGRGRGRRRGK